MANYRVDEDEWIEGFSDMSPDERDNYVYRLVGMLEQRLENLVNKLVSESNYSTSKAIEEAQKLVNDGRLNESGTARYSGKSTSGKDEGDDSPRGAKSA